MEVREQLALEVEIERRRGEKEGERNELESVIEDVVNRTGILEEMLATRKKIELNVKERHQTMTDDLAKKRNKIRRLQDENTKKAHKLAQL